MLTGDTLIFTGAFGSHFDSIELQCRMDVLTFPNVLCFSCERTNDTHASCSLVTDSAHSILLSNINTNSTISLVVGNGILTDFTSSETTFSNHSMTIYVANAPAVELMNPKSGPQVGNSSVEFLGYFYVSRSLGALQIENALVWCKFGSDSNVVSASQVNSTRIVCESPAQNFTGVYNSTTFTERVRVSVSIDGGVTYRDTPFHFHYYQDEVTLTSITPVSGHAMGGSRVTVAGQNFWNSDDIRCSFGRLIFDSTRGFVCVKSSLDCSNRFLRVR